MTSPSTQPDTEEQKIKAAMSFSERRKLREQLQDERGVNIYGGERCKCTTCGDTHWRRREEKKG